MGGHTLHVHNGLSWGLGILPKAVYLGVKRQGMVPDKAYLLIGIILR